MKSAPKLREKQMDQTSRREENMNVPQSTAANQYK